MKGCCLQDHERKGTITNRNDSQNMPENGVGVVKMWKCSPKSEQDTAKGSFSLFQIVADNYSLKIIFYLSKGNFFLENDVCPHAFPNSIDLKLHYIFMLYR